MKKIVETTDFELVGGYRISPANEAGFIAGSMAIDINPISRRLWLDSHHNKVMQYNLPEIGTGLDWTKWPFAVKVLHYTPSQLGIYQMLEGMVFDHITQKLFVSTRNGYFVPPTDPEYWVASVSFPYKIFKRYKVKNNGTQAIMNRFGGGMCLVPAEYSVKLNGKRIAFSSGGYKSGQASTCGPSLAVWNEADEINYQELLRFAWFGSKNPSYTENRPPNYNDLNLNWYIPAKDGIGYWQADSIYGGAAWIEHPAYKGICYIARQGVGDLDYKLQSETFATKQQSMFYTYDPDKLIESPQLVNRGTFKEWNSQGIPGKPRGMVWAGGLLWVCYAQAYKSGVEWYPIIAAYKLKDLENEEMLQEQIDALTNNLNVLLSQMTVLAANDAAVSAQVQSLSSQLSTLVAKVDAIPTTDLTSRVAALEEFKSKVQSLAQQLNS